MAHTTQSFLDLGASGKNHWWRYLVTGLSWAAAFAVCILMVQLWIIPALKSNPNLTGNHFWQEFSQYGLTGAIFSIQLIVVALCVRFLHKRSYKSLNTRDRFPVFQVLEGILIWGGILFVTDLLMEESLFTFLLESRFSVEALLLLPIAIVSVMVQSYSEEVIFRGYVLQGLKLKINNRWVIYLVGSVIFGLLHATAGIDHIFMTFVFGVLFCYIVDARQNIAFATGVHFINNFYLAYILDGFGEEDVMGNFWGWDWIDVGIGLLQFGVIASYIYLRKRRRVKANSDLRLAI